MPSGVLNSTNLRKTLCLVMSGYFNFLEFQEIVMFAAMRLLCLSLFASCR